MLNWWLERNMLVCFFHLLTENGFDFAFITKFSKIFCEHPRVRLTFWKLMKYQSSTTSKTIFFVICWHPRVRLKFYVRFSKMNCAGYSYCQIIGWSLTMNFFWDPSEIFKFLGMICCLRQRWCCKRSPNRSSYLVKFSSKWQKTFGNDLVAFRTGKHVLDIDSWNHSDATMKDLWRRFSWRFNGWSRSWFKIMLWSWGPFIHFVKRSNSSSAWWSWMMCKCWICLRGKIWYSWTAMVDEWNASVLSACFRSPLQFNCKLVRYCNIWLSRWTRRRGFPCCIPSCGFLTLLFSPLRPFLVGWFLWNQTLSFPSPREGLVELLLWVFWTLLCSFWR